MRFGRYSNYTGRKSKRSDGRNTSGVVLLFPRNDPGNPAEINEKPKVSPTIRRVFYSLVLINMRAKRHADTSTKKKKTNIYTRVTSYDIIGRLSKPRGKC